MSRENSAPQADLLEAVVPHILQRTHPSTGIELDRQNESCLVLPADNKMPA